MLPHISCIALGLTLLEDEQKFKLGGCVGEFKLGGCVDAHKTPISCTNILR
jgi:hypothetical protein